MKRIVLPIAILTGSVLVAILLIKTPTQVEESSPDMQAVAVRVMEVKRENLQLSVHSQGKVQSAQMVNLSTPVAGQVTWVSPSLEPGGYIAAGNTLLRIDPSDYETEVSKSNAALLQAEAESSYAASDLERIRNLAEQSLASKAQLQGAQRSHAVALARLTDAQASLRQAELDLARTEIKAPFDAIVESKAVEMGQFINRAQNIAILNSANQVEVRVPLAIRQLGFLDIPLGLRGELGADEAPRVKLTGMYGGQQLHWQGRLIRVEGAIDAASNAVQSIIRVQQPAAGDSAVDDSSRKQIPLPIGLYVQAEIEGRHVDNIIALPRKVIRNNSQVLVVDAENKMYYREVEIFRLEDDRVLISGGILPGELICVSPIQAVYDGMSVQPIEEII